MKTILQRMLKTALSLGVLMLLNGMLHAQTAGTALTMRLQNAIQTAPNQFTYDMVLQNTGTVNVAIKAYSWGVNYAAGMNNGGTISHAFLTRDPLLSTIPAVGPGVNTPANHLRAITTSATAGNEVLLPVGNSVLLATMRVTTTSTFPVDFNPALTLQSLTQSGRTSCVVNVLIGTVGYSVNSAGNLPLAGSIQALTNNVNTTCFYLNPTSALSAANTSTTAVSCFGGNNGTAEISLSGTGSGAVGTYTIDGGASTGYFTNPFTVTGLTGGTHTIAINTAYNCTATTTTTISSPNSPITTTDNATACDSYTWALNGATYTASGVYTGTALNGSGCTVAGTLNLTINNSTSNVSNVNACLTYSWPVDNATYTNSGTYTVTSMNAAGCLHSEVLNLTIFTPTTSNEVVTACDSYLWTANGATYTAGGIYTFTYLNVGGCTHTATLDLTLFYSSSSSETQTACDSYTWNISGLTYTTSGTYTFTTLNASGCAHTNILNLTINNSTSTVTNITSCDSYSWNANNTTYTASGTYTITSMNTAGCVQTDVLNLTINYSSNSTSSITACDSYVWADNGMTYTASGTYTATSLNSTGCLHTSTLNLTINSSSASSSSVTACDSYLWSQNGLTYTASGTYTSVGLNALGCPDTYTLNLTINNSSNSSSSATACDSYFWSQNGTTYTASGTYTSVGLNALGCSDIHTLNLTINPSTSSSATVVACDSYTWTENNMTYSTSGTYTFTSFNSNGCLHTSTLNLTVNSSSSSSSSVTACDSYQWMANGNTYTASGTYTATGINAAGCTEALTLVLTINNSTSSSSAVTACDSYTWSENGATYTTSGVYTSTSLNAVGCTQAAVLNLTINYSTMVSSNVTACDSYTWADNGMTYTTSGTYSVSSINSAGCSHTSELVLTINNSSSSTDNATACDSYVWAANGQTYTTSGTYTATSLNTSGCLHTSTLNLVVNYSTTSSSTVTACSSYTWAVDGQTYTVSGVYTTTSLNSVGCTNTSTLNLTIVHGSYLAIKAILSGALNVTTGLMNDDLRVQGLIPTTEPYTAAPYNKPVVMFASGDTIGSGVLANSGNDAIVDWVFIELRSAANSSSIVGTIRALIQRDGDVVSANDGLSPVFLPGVLSGSYFVSLKHRNHLGVMTSAPMNFSYCATTSVDFTTGTVWVKPFQVYAPRRMYGAVATLWSSDANNNKATRYNGLSNDKDAVLTAVGVGTPNNVLSNVYRMEDVNLDGFIKYNNFNNDRVVIQSTVVSAGGTNNATVTQHTPN
ncbi:MAG: hypothetical protein IPI46_10965 [Bacteroidetes bacterium]|nr:hypothetical protein [Bacteroidota bacterium]